MYRLLKTEADCGCTHCGDCFFVVKSWDGWFDFCGLFNPLDDFGQVALEANKEGPLRLEKCKESHIDMPI